MSTNVALKVYIRVRPGKAAEGFKDFATDVRLTAAASKHSKHLVVQRAAAQCAQADTEKGILSFNLPEASPLGCPVYSCCTKKMASLTSCILRSEYDVNNQKRTHTFQFDGARSLVIKMYCTDL